MLLLCWGMTFGVNESRVSNQVPSVLHYEAPKIKMNKTGSQDQLNEFINLVLRQNIAITEVFIQNI